MFHTKENYSRDFINNEDTLEFVIGEESKFRILFYLVRVLYLILVFSHLAHIGDKGWKFY